MANLAAIKAEVLRIVESQPAALTAAVTTHIQRAQKSIESRSQFKIQETSVTFQVVSGTLNYAQPADYIAILNRPYYLDTLTTNYYTFLDERLEFETLGLAGSMDPPKYWREFSDLSTVSFQFWPQGDADGPSVVTPLAYDVVIPYIGRLSTLTQDSDTNFWTTEMDDVLAWKAAAMMFAELRDPMASFWNSVAAARYLEIKNDMKRNKLRSLVTRITPSQPLGSRNQQRYGRPIITKVP